MIALIIGGAIAVLLALVGTSHLRLCIAYRDSLTVKLKGPGFSHRIFPNQEDVDLSDYSAKERKKNAKKQAKQEKKAKQKSKQAKKASLIPKSIPEFQQLFSDVKDAFSTLPSHLLRHAKIRSNRIVVIIGTEDAATTAYLCGWVRNGAMVLDAYLTEHFQYSKKANHICSVTPDFVHGKTSVEIDIELRVRIGAALILGLKGLRGFLKFKQKRRNNHDRQQTE